jgi:hypothetical protein
VRDRDLSDVVRHFYFNINFIMLGIEIIKILIIRYKNNFNKKIKTRIFLVLIKYHINTNGIVGVIINIIFINLLRYKLY